jgi:hypothetical protein
VVAGLDGLGEALAGLGNGVRPGEADGVKPFGAGLCRDGGAQRDRVAQKSRSA